MTERPPEETEREVAIIAAQARVIEAARLAVMAYPCHTRQLAEALAMLEAEGTE